MGWWFSSFPRCERHSTPLLDPSHRPCSQETSPVALLHDESEDIWHECQHHLKLREPADRLRYSMV